MSIVREFQMQDRKPRKPRKHKECFPNKKVDPEIDSECDSSDVGKLKDEAKVASKGDEKAKNEEVLPHSFISARATHITLSDFLNAVDGPGAQEGRLLIMTTNAIKSLDPP